MDWLFSQPLITSVHDLRVEGIGRMLSRTGHGDLLRSTANKEESLTAL